jgi:hypothetical protein
VINREAGSRFIRANFKPEDRLAVVLIQKHSGSVTQRLASASQIADDKFQNWLRHMNAHRHEVYVSMNPLRPEARGRTKSDLAGVRHVYLDFDKDGDRTVAAMQSREDLPPPNHLIETSPGHWQAIWRVEGFDVGQAEALMRGMVRELGADPAATDATRVLRMPGYLNHKRDPAFVIRTSELSDAVSHPADFAELSSHLRSNFHASTIRAPASGGTGQSQSERDWAYAKRALARGDDPSAVVGNIAAYRPDKPNPTYYAERTVRKALTELRSEAPQSRGLDHFDR